jgi:hypothetical protein
MQTSRFESCNETAQLFMQDQIAMQAGTGKGEKKSAPQWAIWTLLY